ncbi:DUF4235 domain-containing protein [Arcanobacterium hippocoleae]|uniref:DUF4235 domain-containing protein n=1 Tax=Arcanobacterium hippocoleae TaxID=149017 RepID=UPI003341BABC
METRKSRCKRGAGFIVQKGVEVFWEKVLKNQKPKGDDTDADLPAIQIAAFAAVTAGVNAIVTALIDRKMKEKYRNGVESDA